MTTKPNEPEGLIERAARHVLDNSRKGNASLNEHQRAADDEKLMTSYRDIIGKALSFIAAHPVADAGGVTDADREAAAKCVEHGLSRPNPLNVRQGVVDSWHLIQAFARHRLQSVAAETAAKDAAIRARDDHFRNLQTLSKKYAQVCRAKTDLEYMQVELVGMLGPKAKQVWDMWQQKGLCRIHVSWLSHLQGEDRAEAHMEIDQAPKTVIDSVDGNLQKRPYGDTFSAFDAIADEVKDALSEARETGALANDSTSS